MIAPQVMVWSSFSHSFDLKTAKQFARSSKVGAELSFSLLQIAKATDTILEVDSELAEALEDIKEYTGNNH